MDRDSAYSGRIPEIYDTCLGRMIFAPYAADLAARARSRTPRRVLELAAGTGILTEALARALPDAGIDATDLNQAMIDFARSRRPHVPARWSTADATALPFEDGTFDLVACQFGAMFFPDCVKAFGEARRVLVAGGAFIFSVWTGLDGNDFARAVSETARSTFPDDPPLFLARTPYGHGDPARLEREARAAGFTSVVIERVVKRSRGPSPRDAALGFAEGTPLRYEIEARDAGKLGDVVDRAEAAIRAAYGTDSIDGQMSALVITAS